MPNTINGPFVIEATSGDIATIGSQGDVWLPIFNGTNRYAIGLSQVISTGKSNVRMFKSTDSGVTWIPQDTAHEPTYANGISGIVQPTKFGTVIFMVYNKQTVNGQFVNSFDMSTDSWGTESPPSSENGGRVQWRRLSSGAIVVVYQRQFGGPYSVKLEVYAGGVWSGLTTVTSNATDERTFMNLALDSSDRIFIVTREKSATAFFHDMNVRIYASGSVGAPALIESSQNPASLWGPGVYIATSDEVRFPVILSSEDVLGFSSPGYWTGTPSSSPIWTLVDLHIYEPDPSSFTPTITFAFENDNDIYLAWVGTTDEDTGQISIRFSEQLNLGEWSDQQVLWDSIDNPLSPPSEFPGDAQFMGITFDTTTGRLATVLGLFQDFSSLGIGEWCGVLYYLDANPGFCQIIVGTGSKKFIPQYTKNAAVGNN